MRFIIPGFSDPLMSPHFLVLSETPPVRWPDSPHLNLLGPLTPPIRDSLTRHGLAPDRPLTAGVIPLRTNHPSPLALDEHPLAALLPRADYQALIAAGFPEDHGFLRQVLLPFLITCNADFRGFTVSEDDRLIATATAGIAGDVALVFNLTVTPARRGTRTASAVREAIKSILGRRGLTHIVFWTSQPIIQRFAPEQTPYTIARSR